MPIMAKAATPADMAKFFQSRRATQPVRPALMVRPAQPATLDENQSSRLIQMSALTKRWIPRHEAVYELIHAGEAGTNCATGAAVDQIVFST